MISLRPTLLAAAMAAIALPAAAQAEDAAPAAVAPAPRTDPCISQTANETEARACLDEQVAYGENEVRTAYRELQEVAGGSETPLGMAIQAEQLAWMKFYDASCAQFEGEQDPLVKYGRVQRCLQHHLFDRAGDLILASDQLTGRTTN